MLRNNRFKDAFLFRFEAGGNMQQGMYVPKHEVWETMYDPIYVLLRAVHRRDFQSSIDRFNA